MLREADPGAGGGLPYTVWVVLSEDFSIWLLQESLPVAEGRSPAWFFVSNVLAEGGALWVGDSHGGLCTRTEGAPLCTRDVCALARRAVRRGQA